MPTPGASTFPIPGRRVNFTWGRPSGTPAPWQFGVFCFFRLGKSLLTGRPFVPTPTEARIYPWAVMISVRGLLQWLAVLSVLAYFGGAGMIHARLAQDPFNRVGYRDLVAPWRWSSVPALRGGAMLERGKASYAAGRIAEAIYLLRAGLAHQPSDGDARMLLANSYVALLRRDLAEAVIFDGLEKGAGEASYLRTSLALLGEADRPSRILDFCRRARALALAGGPAGLVIDAAEAGALLELGEPRRALELLDNSGEAGDPALRRLRVRAALAAEDLEGAVTAALEWTRAFPESAEAAAALVDAFRRARRFDDMDASLEKLRRRAATNVDVASMGVLQNLMAGRRAEAAAAFDGLILRFGSNSSLLARLAGQLADMGELDFLGRLEEVFREHGFDPQHIWFGRLVALITKAEWDAARDVQRALLARKEKLAPSVRAFAETAGPLIEYCSAGTPAAKAAVLEMLVRHRGRLSLYLRISDALVAARRWEGARDVLLLAEGLYPQGRRIEERRRQIAPELDNLAAAARRRAAGERNLSGIGEKFPDANAFFAALEADRAEKKTESALKRISDVRREAPDWFPRVRDRIDRCELNLAMEADDLPRLKMVAHGFLREGEPARVGHVLGLIREAKAAGAGSVARVLMAEVLRRDPQGAAGAGLVVETEETDSPGNL